VAVLFGVEFASKGMALNRFFRNLILMLFSFWLGMPSVQAATYAYRNDVFAYDTPSASATTLSWHNAGTSPACTNYPQGDDDWADVTFPTGFTFTFAGTAQSSMRVYSNGMLAFGGDNSGYWRQFGNLTLPITAASGQTYTGCPNTVPSNVIIAYWTDIVAGTANSTTGASVQYELLGTAPNRRLVVSWVNVKLYGQTARYNFQVALYESPAGGLNSNFKYQYTTGSSTGAAATVGVQVGTADYTLYSYNNPFIDPVAGSAILWYPANQLAAKSAEYRFDEGIWNGTPNEVKDTSGSSNHGVRVGASTNITAGKLCRGGSFTSNTSNATIDAVSTPITPVNVGSIDFWYKSAVAWNAGSSDAMLIDATTVVARPFFLMKKANGALQFTLTDSGNTVWTLTSPTYTTAAGTWVHVGMSWNLRPGTNQTLLQIFVNGVTVASSRLTSSGGMTSLSTIYIGDNRTSGVTPNTGTPNGANATLDEVYVYNTEINATQAAADMNLVRSACGTLDHFHILHNGELVNCGNPVTNVTIEAHDSTHALLSLAGTLLTLSTSTNHGNWSNVTGGAISTVNNLGNGAATYTFSSEAIITLGLQDSFVESLNINTASGSVTEKSGVASSCVAADYTFGSACDANLSFDFAGFRFVDSNGSNMVDQNAGATSGTYFLQAVKSSCATPGVCAGACTALFPSGSSVNVDVASECVNPTTCQTGQSVTFTPGVGAGTAGAVAANNNGTVSASTGSYTTKLLTFNAASPNPLPAVPFTFRYSDVGKIRLWARYTGGSSTISGNSATVVVQPDHFSFSGVTASPIKAGKNFSATVTSLNSAGVATPNFGKETVAEGVTLAFVMYQPTGVGAQLGSFSGADSLGAFGSGVATSNGLSWSEVGTMDLTAALTRGSYLGTLLTPAPTGKTGTTGALRFIPDHFTTEVTPGCGLYTYSGQPFTVKVSAWNGAGMATKNYDGTASTTPNFSKAVILTDGNGATVGGFTGTTASIPASAFSGGVATVTTPAYAFTTLKTVPTSIVLRATEKAADGVTSSGADEGPTTIRAGRLLLRSAYGSELMRLPMPLEAQFWQEGGNAAITTDDYWTTNVDDTCTVIPAAAISLGNYKGNLAAGETLVSIGGSFAAGVGSLSLSSPGAGNNGSTDVTINNGTAGVSWFGANEVARATFGLRKTPVIYLRENY